MIGFAARPGIEVDPMCSMRGAVSGERSHDSALLDLEAAGPLRVVVGDHDAPDWLEPSHEHPIGILLPAHVASWLTAVASALVTHLSASTVTVDDIVDALDREGYCIVEGVWSPDEVAEAKASLRQVLDEIPFGRNDFEGHHTRRVYALFAKTCAFDAAAIHPLLLGVLDRVLEQYQLSAPTGIQIAPGERAQVLHYDASVYPLPRDFRDVVVNTMWALDDFTVENGATRIIPGSHRWVDRQPTVGDVVDDGDARGLGHLLRRQGLPRRRRELDRQAAARRDPRVRRGMASSSGDASPRGATAGRRRATRAAPGALGIQHLSTVPRLRRRASSPSLHHK